MRTVYGDHDRFQTYFSTYTGNYFTATAVDATQMAITDHRPVSTT